MKNYKVKNGAIVTTIPYGKNAVKLYLLPIVDPKKLFLKTNYITVYHNPQENILQVQIFDVNKNRAYCGQFIFYALPRFKRSILGGASILAKEIANLLKSLKINKLAILIHKYQQIGKAEKHFLKKLHERGIKLQ